MRSITRVALTAVVAASVIHVGTGDRADAEALEPTAIVSIGDSFISGEAARWKGNSTDGWGDRDGTDRAYRGLFGYDVDSIYIDGTNRSGCHRADPAPVTVTFIRVDAKLNLACAGARAEHVISSDSGGQWYRGEAPQADQLADVADSHLIEMVVVSIGGNDLGYSDIILDCTVAYTTSLLWWKNRCAENEQTEVDAALRETMAGVARALRDIRAVLDDNGDGDARVVLMSYPSPVPRGEELRYGSRWSRIFEGGCPFWRSDLTWARDSLVPQIAGELRSVAREVGVEFLDLQDLFDGREVCSKTAAHSDGSPSSYEDEWVRFVTTGLLQGEAQESLHPNYFGQRAIGRCIELVMVAEPGGEWTCTNRPGYGAWALDLTEI
jgi:lysophospholipase L1-like esterase